MHQGKYIKIVDRLNYVLLYFRDVFMEKHWKTVVGKSICDYFFEAQTKVNQILIRILFKE
jgi:hypothetical protein